MKKLILTLLVLSGSVAYAQEYYTLEAETNVPYEKITPDSFFATGQYETGGRWYIDMPFVPRSHFKWKKRYVSFGAIDGNFDGHGPMGNNSRHLWTEMFSGHRGLNGKDSTSYVGYQILDTGSDSLLKLEYYNATYTEGGAEDSINCQLWIYKSGIIEYHYGGISVKNPKELFFTDTVPSVYLVTAESNGKNGFNYFARLSLINDPDKPDVVKYASTPGDLHRIPSKGTVYRFTPQIFYTSVNEPHGIIELNAYPNPTTGTLYFKNKHLTYPLKVTITNELGQVSNFEIVSTTNQITLSQKGLLIVSLEDAKGLRYSQRIISK